MPYEIATRLPEWGCHKTVRAAKIVSVEESDTGVGTLTLLIDREDVPQHNASMTVTTAYMRKHQPKAGDIYVLYKDGYESCSPADAFLEGYTRLSKQHDFSWALKELVDNQRVRRAGWNGKGMFVFLVPGSRFKVNRFPLLGIYPEGTEITYQPHIDMKTAQDTVVPWLASQGDLLATDWEIAD